MYLYFLPGLWWPCLCVNVRVMCVNVRVYVCIRTRDVCKRTRDVCISNAATRVSAWCMVTFCSGVWPDLCSLLVCLRGLPSLCSCGTESGTAFHLPRLTARSRPTDLT